MTKKLTRNTGHSDHTPGYNIDLLAKGMQKLLSQYHAQWKCKHNKQSRHLSSVRPNCKQEWVLHRRQRKKCFFFFLFIQKTAKKPRVWLFTHLASSIFCLSYLCVCILIWELLLWLLFFHRPPLSAFFVLAFHSLLLLLFIPSDFDCTKKARTES